MSGPYFIETLARNGDVLHRQRLDTLPIRIGRGYDNDVILDDDYAAARHAVVEAAPDGALQLRDLGSRNGVVVRGKRQPCVALTGQTVARIGHTSLRVRAAGDPAPPELLDRTMHGWEGALPGLAGMALAAAVALVLTWLFDVRNFQATRYLQALAIGVGAAALWGGVWAFANRLFGRHARLGRHLFIAGCGAFALLVFELGSSALAYAFAWEVLTRYGSHVAIALLAGTIYFHLATVKPPLRLRFRWLCLAFALVASGLMLIGNIQRNGRFADELYMGVLLPPGMRASPDRSVDDYVDQVEAMKARMEQERRKDDDNGA